MKVYKYIDSVKDFEAWGNAVNTIKKVIEAGCLEDLDNLLRNHFASKPISETELNDFLAFKDDYIFDYCDIENDED